MGLPLAENLLKAGYRLKVYNRTKSKLAPLLKLGAEAVERPAEVVEPGTFSFIVIISSPRRAMQPLRSAPQFPSAWKRKPSGWRPELRPCGCWLVRHTTVRGPG